MRSGLREDIWLYEDKILDGRNRYRVCVEAGETPRFKRYGGDSPVDFVVSLNLHRRHLSEPQREMAGAKIATMKHGGDRKSGSDQTAKWQLETTVSKAAKLLNVSERGVGRAKQIRRTGTPELIKKVEDGTVRVSTAATIAQLPAKEQLAILAKQDPRAVQQASKQINRERREAKAELHPILREI